jgi:uncharacterized protein YjbI with pentapeptide repeats
MKGADMKYASLWGSSLRDVNLEGADLRGAQMGDVDLRGADMKGANLRNRGFPEPEVDMAGADLGDADLAGADLRGVDLSEVHNLKQTQVDLAHGDEETKLPVWIIRPESWKKKKAATLPTPPS